MTFPSGGLRRFGVAALAAGFFGAAAQAGVLVSYSSFSSCSTGSGLTCEGTAGVVGGALQLTWSGVNLSGAAFSTAPVNLGAADTFSTTFNFSITNPAGVDPADGFTFVLASGTGAFSSIGGGLGYGNLANSIAIEFDTYNNSGSDNSSNHVGVDTAGALTDTPQADVYGISNCAFIPDTTAGCLSNGDTWTATIAYDGSDLTVKLFDPAKGFWVTPIDNYAVDLPGTIGTNTVYAGFTASTGSGTETHDILNWDLDNNTSLLTPEPAMPLLLLSGLGMLVFWKRRRA